MKRSTAVLFLLLVPSLASGQDVPGCAVTGSKTVMIGGKPALRLSDVVMCPPDSYEIISSIMIDGQPMRKAPTIDAAPRIPVARLNACSM